MDNHEVSAVYQLGPFQVNQKYLFHNYLLQVGDIFVLFDIVPFQKWDLLHLAIHEYCKISDINYLVLSYTSMSTMHVLLSLIDEGFEGTIITNRVLASQIIDAELHIKVLCIEDIDGKYYIGKKEFLRFHTLSYTPLPKMFMTYSSVGKAFFTSIFLSSYYYHDASVTSIKKSIFNFHRENISSSEYVKPHLKTIEQASPKAVYPLFGYVIQSYELSEVIDYLMKMDFYNSSLFSLKHDIDQEINYIEIINHMLLHLSKFFTKMEIIDLFIGSPFHLVKDQIELKKSTLDGFKLYHGFFEYIYTKKGPLWLSILEPVVQRYIDIYHLEVPSIYRSQIVEKDLEKDKIIAQKNDMEQELKRLKEHMVEVTEQALRCPITKLYKEDVLIEMLKAELIERKEKASFGLFLIQLDQIVDFNNRYGKDIGDESIRNMSYIVEQIKKPTQLLFKHHGPSIILYDQYLQKNEVHDLMNRIRNEVKDSQLFIEKSTVTISTVSIDEISAQENHEITIHKMIEILERRLMIIKIKGNDFVFKKDEQDLQIDEGKILLVDDDEISRNMLYRIFKRLHYDILLAKGVKEAIELVDEYKVDLIISEINLSKIDGFTLKQILNQNEKGQQIPFIMVSHNKSLENIKRGNALDVDLILDKPIIPDELIGHVKRFKERRKR